MIASLRTRYDALSHRERRDFHETLIAVSGLALGLVVWAVFVGGVA